MHIITWTAVMKSGKRYDREYRTADLRVAIDKTEWLRSLGTTASNIRHIFEE